MDPKLLDAECCERAGFVPGFTALLSLTVTDAPVEY
jgi:hypothetical protein